MVMVDIKVAGNDVMLARRVGRRWWSGGEI